MHEVLGKSVKIGFSGFVLNTAVAIVALLLPTSAAAADEAPPTPPPSFNFEIRPLLSDRCFTCHGPDERSRKAKLRLDTREGLFAPRADGSIVVRPGDSKSSELYRRITTSDPDDRMPPHDSKLSLSEAEIEILKRWIDAGALWSGHWSLNPVVRPRIPEVRDRSWTRHPIDHFVLAKIEARGLKPSSQASPERLIRRMAFDLTGLPPEVASMEMLLARNPTLAPELFAEQLLASAAFGERMANDWLDVARYADTYGYQADVDRDMYPWRDWVVQAFNQNLSYDRFILWQLAGDLIRDPTRESRLATAFNRLHRQTNEGGSIEEEFRSEYVSDRIHTMGTAFLGLTLECARCHDHKYDPVKQKDYYSLAALFNNIDESGLYSHFTRATPTPAMPLYASSAQEIEHATLRRRIADHEAKLNAIKASPAARRRFEDWQRRDGATAKSKIEIAPVAHYNFDATTSNSIPNLVATNAATLVDSPEIVPVGNGHAVRFSGDNSVICKGTGEFARTQPFSVALNLLHTGAVVRAVVAHASRAWTDSASRGWELVLEHGKPFFGLIHFWPGNAIAIRGLEPLPANRWLHLTLAYDGSSQAKGLRLYLDGQPLRAEIVRDDLTRDIRHRKDWGDSDVGGIPLTLGGRFRDSGFKGGMIDELAVYDRCLTEVEAGEVLSVQRAGDATAIAARDEFAHYLARHDSEYLAAESALLESRMAEDALITRIPEIMVMREMAGRRATHVLRRGAYDAPGDRVEPAAPSAVMPFDSRFPTNRLGLAQWMTDPRHPLTARVAINRVWKLHFGRGLVATTGDFGAQGELPSHPELLDWLASWFMENGWDRKALHRLIVNSAAYRQSSKASAELEAMDPENRLLARGPAYRLEAEQIRDEALAASGLLSRRLGGPSVKPYQPAKLWEESGTGKSYVQDKGESLYRRSLYTFWRRTAPPPSMLAFDATTREVCVARRESTATPLQALVLLNDPQFVEASRVLAARLVLEDPGDSTRQIQRAVWAVLSRPPNTAELEVLARLHTQQKKLFEANPAAATSLLQTGEHAKPAGVPETDAAALTQVIAALMNHDEFVMRR